MEDKKKKKEDKKKRETSQKVNGITKNSQLTLPKYFAKNLCDIPASISLPLTWPGLFLLNWSCSKLICHFHFF